MELMDRSTNKLQEINYLTLAHWTKLFQNGFGSIFHLPPEIPHTFFQAWRQYLSFWQRSSAERDDFGFLESPSSSSLWTCCRIVRTCQDRWVWKRQITSSGMLSVEENFINIKCIKLFLWKMHFLPIMVIMVIMRAILVSCSATTQVLLASA